MWIVESPSPSHSAPPTPSSAPAVLHPPPSPVPLSQPPFYPLSSTPAISAAALPGFGRLSGVVSLTDILNLYARASGLHPGDLEEARRKRRGSSSSSVSVGYAAGVRGSLDSARSSTVDVREKR